MIVCEFGVIYESENLGFRSKAKFRFLGQKLNLGF